MELIINVDEKLVCEGFERPFTEEERNILIRAIGNGRPYNPSGDLISRDDALKAVDERPKGEWKRITEETANIQMFLCSVCGRKVEVGYSHISPSVYYPFCHCGADMRTEDK